MRSSSGFSLIELLLVTLIIGILATIAIPRLTSARDRAFVATMQADLRNLATQQEIYYADNLTYSDSDAALGFMSSDRVTVTIVEGVGDRMVRDSRARRIRRRRRVLRVLRQRGGDHAGNSLGARRYRLYPLGGLQTWAAPSTGNHPPVSAGGAPCGRRRPRDPYVYRTVKRTVSTTQGCRGICKPSATTAMMV